MFNAKIKKIVSGGIRVSKVSDNYHNYTNKNVTNALFSIS